MNTIDECLNDYSKESFNQHSLKVNDLLNEIMKTSSAPPIECNRIVPITPAQVNEISATTDNNPFVSDPLSIKRPNVEKAFPKTQKHPQKNNSEEKITRTWFRCLNNIKKFALKLSMYLAISIVCALVVSFSENRRISRVKDLLGFSRNSFSSLTKKSLIGIHKGKSLLTLDDIALTLIGILFMRSVF